MNQRFVNPQSGGDQRENINKIGRGCFYMETPEFSDIAQEQKKKVGSYLQAKYFGTGQKISFGLQRGKKMVILAENLEDLEYFESCCRFRKIAMFMRHKNNNMDFLMLNIMICGTSNSPVCKGRYAKNEFSETSSTPFDKG